MASQMADTRRSPDTNKRRMNNRLGSERALKTPTSGFPAMAQVCSGALNLSNTKIDVLTYANVLICFRVPDR